MKGFIAIIVGIVIFLAFCITFGCLDGIFDELKLSNEQIKLQYEISILKLELEKKELQKQITGENK